MDSSPQGSNPTSGAQAYCIAIVTIFTSGSLFGSLMFRFRPGSFLWFLLIFLTEVAIALWVHDRLIRPYIGDVLVIPLMYYFVRSFFSIKPKAVIGGVLAFAFLVEFAQYANLVRHLGLEHNRFWVIVIGNSFHWLDLVAYVAGAAALYFLEHARSRKKMPNS